MSNIAIKGATTGTGVFTLESPATNTDRTLVLPDEAGTVLTSASTIPATALAPTLDLSSKTLVLPPENAAMTRLYSGDVTGGVGFIDMDISSNEYKVYKLYIRNWNLASNSQPILRKLISSGVVGNSYYGGATRSGEGAVAQVHYSNQNGFYLLGDTTTTTVSNNAYLMAWDITITHQTLNNMVSMFGNGVARVTGGRTQNINTGSLTIDENAFWGIRIAANANTTNIKYALYGVNSA